MAKRLDVGVVGGVELMKERAMGRVGGRPGSHVEVVVVEGVEVEVLCVVEDEVVAGLGGVWGGGVWRDTVVVFHRSSDSCPQPVSLYIRQPSGSSLLSSDKLHTNSPTLCTNMHKYTRRRHTRSIQLHTTRPPRASVSGQPSADLRSIIGLGQPSHAAIQPPPQILSFETHSPGPAD